jgi:hypothetical protein
MCTGHGGLDAFSEADGKTVRLLCVKSKHLQEGGITKNDAKKMSPCNGALI